MIVFVFDSFQVCVHLMSYVLHLYVVVGCIFPGCIFPKLWGTKDLFMMCKVNELTVIIWLIAVLFAGHPNMCIHLGGIGWDVDQSTAYDPVKN